MDYNLNGKVALITGSGRGIGLACGIALAKEGASIIVTDIREEAVESATKVLTDQGFKAIGVAADVCDKAQVQAVVDAGVQAFGSVDILVNNAGFTRDKYLTKMPEDDWDAVLDTILKGAYYTTRACLPHMMEKRWGRIVNISSRAHLGNPGQANYSAAKAGILGFTRAIAYEAGKFNITSNAVAPGLVETELVKALPTYERLRENALERQPIQRLGAVEDIANAVTFLASDVAGFITGETVHVTGGRYSS